MTTTVPSGRWPDSFLDEQRQLGDPEADSAIAELHREGNVGAALEILRTLIRNEMPPPEALPESVRHYIHDTRSLPPWADRELILRGEHVFQRWGMQIGMLLFQKVLAEGYLARRFALVLSLTHKLESDPQRRLLETGQLVFDAMAPGGLGIGGQGIATALRVRLLHAALRQLVHDLGAAQPGLLPADFGVPISQEDMAATLMGFSAATLEGLGQLGARISRDDAEAYIHCWRIVGHFVGIDEAMNPSNYAEARELLAAVRRRMYAVTPEGLHLESSMLTMLEEISPRPIRGLPRQMIRYLIGPAYAAQLQVPQSGWAARVAFGAYIRLNRALTGFVSVTHMANLAEPVNRAMLRAMTGKSRGGDRPPFTIPPNLRNKWHI